MPVSGKLPTEGRGLPFPKTLEEVGHDVVCEERANPFWVRRREGRVEAPVFSTTNHGLPVIVATNTRQGTQVVPSGVKLGPTHIAELLEREDVGHDPCGLLAVDAWELAKKPGNTNEKECLQRLTSTLEAATCWPALLCPCAPSPQVVREPRKQRTLWLSPAELARWHRWRTD